MRPNAKSFSVPNLYRANRRDSEASAPAEFPPEQPEADLVADEDEYGAEELADEDEEELAPEAAANGAPKDAEMEGVENGDGEPVNGADDDELSDDGSVDIEGESEDELDDEDEVEGAEGDGMDVDMDEAAPPAGPSGVGALPVATKAAVPAADAMMH